MDRPNSSFNQWFSQAQQQLQQAGIGTARLDTLVLAEDVTEKDRSLLLAHPEYRLANQQFNKLNKYITLRAKHQPLAYIRHKTEFYGREFYINNRVLEPRPESETMIDELKQLRLSSHPTIIDIGTGSGVLAITAKLELPEAKIIGTDIDPACLAVARQNAKVFGLALEFLEGDLLQALPKFTATTEQSVLLCNLPYVPNDFKLNDAAMNEPRLAIFGGIDGLDLYRQLFAQLKSLDLRFENVLTESLPHQHAQLKSIAESGSFRLLKEADFIQVFQFNQYSKMTDKCQASRSVS